MRPDRFFTKSRVIIVAGKGGVGKTAVTAAFAYAASASGLSTLVVEIEGKSGLASAFGSAALEFDQIELLASGQTHRGATHGGITARTITPDDALVEYLHDHGLKRISNRLVASGALDMVATAVPGIRDILVLGKIKQLERDGQFDLVLVDAPAAGHAITFLRSAAGLAEAVKVGPIHSQASEALDMLRNPQRCRVTLVTLPEETPVNELVETAYSIEDEVGVALGPVVVNGVLPEPPPEGVDVTAVANEAGLLDQECIEALVSAAEFRRARTRLQQHQLDRLERDLPLPQLRLPRLFTSELDLEGLHSLASDLLEQIEALPDRDHAND